MSPHDDRHSDRIPFNRTQMLLRGLHTSGVCVLYQDERLAVQLVENPPAGWPAVEAILRDGDAAIFDAVTSERVIAAKRRVLASGIPTRLEVARRREGVDPDWFDLNIEPDQDTAGKLCGLFVSVTDITQFKHREAALKALHYEVSHRSRNLLAILQSILRHTAQRSNSIAEFERKFRGRIGSFAQSQDLLTRNNWQGVRFRQLVESQVSGYLLDRGPDPEVMGADPLLSPNSALHVGLALHELAANSASFGVLATGLGHITISAEVGVDGLELSWIEDLPSASVPDGGSGFGKAILEQVVARAMNGTAEHSITPGRVSYRISWPEPPAA